MPATPFPLFPTSRRRFPRFPLLPLVPLPFPFPRWVLSPTLPRSPPQPLEAPFPVPFCGSVDFSSLLVCFWSMSRGFASCFPFPLTDTIPVCSTFYNTSPPSTHSPLSFFIFRTYSALRSPAACKRSPSRHYFNTCLAVVVFSSASGTRCLVIVSRPIVTPWAFSPLDLTSEHLFIEVVRWSLLLVYISFLP